jgi:alkanesulfonate monooxygenase SsuD/methylene tetrahydromethanopterin reductase-like flavin-dependent oxidoreductase (luciferase family)
MVICAAFRNPALTAKLCATLDVISGGRFEIGIGAGWKEDEWRAYGYGFPPIGERIDIFEEHLEVITRMLAPGRASYDGRHVHVRGAINEPRGLQPHIPLIVGGNGPRRTAGLAVRFADELNFTYIGAAETGRLMAAAPARCEAAGRDPSSLRFSLYTRDEDVRPSGAQRIDFLASLVALGLDRVVCFPSRWGPTQETQERFADDCEAAGAELG